jgi:hypothetical protein
VCVCVYTRKIVTRFVPNSARRTRSRSMEDKVVVLSHIISACRLQLASVITMAINSNKTTTYHARACKIIVRPQARAGIFLSLACGALGAPRLTHHLSAARFYVCIVD